MHEQPIRTPGKVAILLRIICGIAVESGKDMTSDSIRKSDENAMFVCLRKLALENELDDLVIQLPTAVCEDVRWWRNSELLDICIGEVVRQLKGFIC